MDAKDRRSLGAAFGALALTGLLTAGSGGLFPERPPEPDLSYMTRCAYTEPSTLEGYVANLSRDAYMVSGPVRFSFYKSGSMSRPQLVLMVDGAVPGGETARLARASSGFPLDEGEICSFDVAGAIRKP